MDLKWAKREFLIWWGIILIVVVPVLAVLLAMPISVAFTQWYWVSIMPFMIFIDSITTAAFAVPFLILVKVYSGSRWFQVFNWKAISGSVFFGAGLLCWLWLIANPQPEFCAPSGCPYPSYMDLQLLYNLAALLTTLGAALLFVAVVDTEIGLNLEPPGAEFRPNREGANRIESS